MTYSFDASEIINWSDRDDAAHKLPELIFRLVEGTLSEPPSRIDMPSGSSVRVSGWDGVLNVRHGNEWTPCGVSGWEMSCEKGVTSKANQVYKSRTTDPLDLDIPTSTFVFVTPRRWPSKRRWVRERCEEGKWYEVRAYDADDLVAWLRQSEEVTRWLLGVIYKRPFDYEVVQRVKELQMETLNTVKAGFVAMGVDLGVLGASIPTQVKSPDSEPLQNSEQQGLSEKLDSAPGSDSARVDRHRPDTARGDRTRGRTVARQPQIPPPDKPGSLRNGRRQA